MCVILLFYLYIVAVKIQNNHSLLQILEIWKNYMPHCASDDVLQAIVGLALENLQQITWHFVRIMSRRHRDRTTATSNATTSNYLPPLEPFPDEEEIFQPFDQHRPLPLRDSLRLKKVGLPNNCNYNTYAIGKYVRLINTIKAHIKFEEN